jgi:hypothetical protein
MPARLFPEPGKRKDKFTNDTLLLSTFAFEPIALRWARIRERIFFGLTNGRVYEEKLYDFQSSINGENKRKQIAKKI